MNGECARSKLNDLACRTFVDRVLDVGEVVLAPAERIDRRADRRPVRDAADGLQAGVLPVRIGVVIGRQNAAGRGVGRRWRRAYPSRTQCSRHCCRRRSRPRAAAADCRGRAGGAEVRGRLGAYRGPVRAAACAIDGAEKATSAAGRVVPPSAAGAGPGPRAAAADRRRRAGGAEVGGRRGADGDAVRWAALSVHGCAEASFCAEQVAVVPPLLPTQLQLQGPVPVTVVAVPALQRLVVGTLARLAPFEESHAPFTRLGCFCACAWPKTMNEMRRVNTAPRT